MTIEIGRSRIVLGRAVAIYVENRFVDPAGPYIKADKLQPIGRMNGLGNYPTVICRYAAIISSRSSPLNPASVHGNSGAA